MAWKQERVASFCLLPSDPTAGGCSAPDTEYLNLQREEKKKTTLESERTQSFARGINLNQQETKRPHTMLQQSISCRVRRHIVVGVLQGSERPTGRAQCRDFQAGQAICLCLQMARAAAAKGQQNVTRTRPYSGWDHVPVTGRETTPR